MPGITAELVEQHHITPEEYARILKLLGREPTITELGIFSVMWSEHCSYKSSRVHLKRLPTKGARVLQGPGENAGVVDLGHGLACVFKVESHNHPSFVEPFQGAATGVGGILRDIFTMGARPVAIMDSLRFGPIVEDASTRNSPGNVKIAQNRRILRGVVGGIAHYGNCFGVPNVGGETVFETCYQDNPLVNAFALGLAPKDQLFFAKAEGTGNPVIYVGAKTGRDGIHGASLLASSEFSGADGQQKRPNVQVGDPFLEKLLLEACLEAMHSGFVLGIQDMGAAGLTCSTCEMGGRGGVGVEIEMDKVPQRETGMSAYEIMLSESQERMLLVAERGHEAEVIAIFKKWGLDAVEIGTVIPQPVMRVKEHGQVIAEIPNTALTDEAPVYDRPWAPRPRTAPLDPVPAVKTLLDAPRSGQDLGKDLLALLAAPNINSKRWITEQYDSMVRTNTVSGPGGTAGLIRIKETGQALAMALDGNGRYCYLDPKRGARLAVAEASRNVSATGAEPIGGTNCLNFGNPEKPSILWQFSEVIDGMTEACTALSIPITGGNVSFYNETEGRAIYPTPVIGVVGLIENAKAHAAKPFQNADRSVIVLGGMITTDENFQTTFGSSQYAQTIIGELWGLPPWVEMAYEARVQACCRRLIAEGLIESAHDLSDGGLAVAVSECSIAGGIGAMIDFRAAHDARRLLFGEDASRILITAKKDALKQVDRIISEFNVRADEIGSTGGTELRVSQQGQPLFAIAVDSLRAAYEDSFPAVIEEVRV
jgi:phosphoribosylformylglycinamidine synthase II